VTQQLAEARLIQPWPLKVRPAPKADPVTMEGLYQLDLSRLDALKGTDYVALQGAAMALAHAQAFSMANVEQLSRRAAFLAQHAETKPPEDLDSFFSSLKKDDEMKFNFDLW